MKKIWMLVFFAVAMITVIACEKDTDSGSPVNEGPNLGLNTVDRNATYATQALYKNLKSVINTGTLFGQQDATYYGIGWFQDSNRSDVKSVTGSHPAVYGWDLENVVKAMLGWSDVNPSEPHNISTLVKEAYARGGVNTFSWHMQNPISFKNFYDLTPGSVKSILKGGDKYDHYKKNLDVLADFFLSLRDANGKLLPVIFRPFHEHNGSWFWWGKDHSTPDDYKLLFQQTVKYLRDTRNVHNVLYAYSPDRINGINDYLERYPGDDYVDILGFDNYWEFRNETEAPNAVRSIRQIVEYALSKDKVAALTETGIDKLTINDWYTNVLLKNLKADPVAKKISYLMVWRNANTGHFYAPYPGHSAVNDFLQFYNDPYTLFENDMPEMYKAD